MKNRQSGVAAVELALVLPLLLAICFAITEFGRAIYTYDALTKSARDAARYLSTQSAGDAPAQATASNLVVYGNPAGTGSPLVPGLTTSKVKICDAVTTGCTNNVSQGSFPVINTVTVTIRGYTFNPLIDILGFTRFYTGGTSSITSITFDDISVTMRQN
jgi:Flp pilus assembly protein TadG